MAPTAAVMTCGAVTEIMDMLLLLNGRKKHLWARSWPQRQGDRNGYMNWQLAPECAYQQPWLLLARKTPNLKQPTVCIVYWWLNSGSTCALLSAYICSLMWHCCVFSTILLHHLYIILYYWYYLSLPFFCKIFFVGKIKCTMVFKLIFLRNMGHITGIHVNLNGEVCFALRVLFLKGEKNSRINSKLIYDNFKNLHSHI